MRNLFNDLKDSVVVSGKHNNLRRCIDFSIQRCAARPLFYGLRGVSPYMGVVTFGMTT